MMKRLIFITLTLAAVLSGCMEGREKVYQQSLEEISKQELATALEERDRLLALFKEVTAALEDIRQLDDMVAANTSTPGRHATQSADILTSISQMKKRIAQHQSQLETLEKELQISTINNGELNELTSQLRRQLSYQMNDIDKLSRQLTAANEHIGQLTRSIDSLNTTASAIAEQRDEAIENSLILEDELNSCYYVVASKDDLKSHNMISSGFLRKTQVIPTNFDRNLFIKADKRRLQRLDMGSPKARILTNHPASSYSIEETNSTKTLHIIDPDDFWKASDFIVIQND